MCGNVVCVRVCVSLDEGWMVRVRLRHVRLTWSQPPASFVNDRRSQPRGRYLVSLLLNFWCGHEFGPPPLPGFDAQPHSHGIDFSFSLSARKQETHMFSSIAYK